MDNVMTFLYVNHRGEPAVRTVVPQSVWFGKTEWHKDEQWFLKAYDVDRMTLRDFAMADIKEIYRRA